MQLISDELAEALVAQWGHEIYNSNLYAYIMAYLKNKGFENIAKHFGGQVSEEREHAEIILGLLTDLNTDFEAPAIDGCAMGFNSIVDVANAYLSREVVTTDSLGEIKQMAIDEGNHVVEECIRGMISLQQKEYAEATDFSDKCDILGSDWKAVLLFDASLG